jgi:hypothetical protein
MCCAAWVEDGHECLVGIFELFNGLYGGRVPIESMDGVLRPMVLDTSCSKWLRLAVGLIIETRFLEVLAASK